MKGGRDAARLAHRTRYFATREGVQLLKDDNSSLPATKKQQQYIRRLLRSFPAASELPEHEDYVNMPSRQTAFDLIAQIHEDFIEPMDSRENYLDYVANRPGVKALGEHGLWDANGKVPSLENAVAEVAQHTGNVWTPVISLSRENAERLGYTNLENWQALINATITDIAKGYKINPNHIRWYAAMHEKEKHIHVHMVIFSSNPSEGYLSRQGIRNIKSALVNTIYRNDRMHIYEQKDRQRNLLQQEAESQMSVLIEQMATGTLQSDKLELLIKDLSKRLQEVGGKKVYGYLPPRIKRIVDEIVDELSKDERVSTAYSLWQDLREELCKDFNQTPPMRVPLSQQKEFKTVRNFPEMLNRSLDKTFNLLASSNNFPKGMIVGFAKAAPEEVRAMFIALFDESKDVYERMNAFKLQSSILLEKYGNGAAQHYQYENAISTYLWLRYPDKYYIYKFGEVKTVANELEAEYHFKKGAYADNIRNFLKLYDEISLALKEDKELVNLFQSQMTDTCYPDPELKTLTIDVGFYISRYYSQKDTAAQEEAEWFPATYSPGITVDEWIKLLNDSEVFTTASLEIMKRMKDYGGQATCKQLSVKSGQSSNFYNAGSSTLAKRIADKTGCPLMEVDTENSKWWPILYVGRSATKDEQGSYIWKLRDELSEALDKIDLSEIELYVKAAPGEEDRGYWWLNANPKIWSFTDIAVGEVQSYTLYNENGNKRRIFQNFLDAKAGDMIIGYESNPVKQIVAIGRVSAEQDGEKL